MLCRGRWVWWFRELWGLQTSWFRKLFGFANFFKAGFTICIATVSWTFWFCKPFSSTYFWWRKVQYELRYWFCSSLHLSLNLLKKIPCLWNLFFFFSKIIFKLIFREWRRIKSPRTGQRASLLRFSRQVFMGSVNHIKSQVLCGFLYPDSKTKF